MCPPRGWSLVAATTPRAQRRDPPGRLADGDGYRMLYAGKRNTRLSVGLATSDDGIRGQPRVKSFALAAETGTDLRRRTAPSHPEGGWRLWYWARRLSMAHRSATTATAGPQIAPRGYQFDSASRVRDDSGVKDAWGSPMRRVSTSVQWVDGDAWRIGYAFRAEEQPSPSRPRGHRRPRYLIDYVDSRSTALMQSVSCSADGRRLRDDLRRMDSDTVRVGRAFGFAPDRFNTIRTARASATR